MTDDLPRTPRPHDPARPYPVPPRQPEIITGPSPTTTALGLLLVVLSVLVLLDQLLGVDIRWQRTLPWLAIGGGAVVLILGVIGMLSARRNS